MPVAYIQVHFRLDFMEANNMNPYQTAAKGAVKTEALLFAR